jgi:hypothetical protein
MRSFTGREAFDETLPVADGALEVSFQVDTNRLRTDMEDWFTRKFGEGKPVQLTLTESGRKQAEGSKPESRRQKARKQLRHRRLPD